MVSDCFYFSCSLSFLYKHRCSKENYKPNSTYPSLYSSRKKRPVIDEETQSIIKRFKKDTEDKSAVQTLHDTSMQPNLARNSNRKRTRDEPTIAISDNTQQEDMLGPNFLNMKFRYFSLE